MTSPTTIFIVLIPFFLTQDTSFVLFFLLFVGKPQKEFAPNIVTGFARMEGHTIGIVGNNPMALAGCLDIDASIKAARFVRFCDAQNIPIVTMVDVPGYIPSLKESVEGMIVDSFSISPALVSVVLVL